MQLSCKWEVKLAIIPGLIHHFLHKKMPEPGQEYNSCLICLSFWFCHLIRDFLFWLFLRVQYFCYFFNFAYQFKDLYSQMYCNWMALYSIEYLYIKFNWKIPANDAIWLPLEMSAYIQTDHINLSNESVHSIII